MFQIKRLLQARAFQRIPARSNRLFTTIPPQALQSSKNERPEGSQVPPHEPKNGKNTWVFASILVGTAIGFYFAYKDDIEKQVALLLSPSKLDYNEVYKSIAAILENSDYDDGSYAPLLIRLAWHASGTYDKNTNTGGSNGATMRFNNEANHGANKGLDVARQLLEPIKRKYPQISYADLWTLAGVVAVQEIGGPVIPWRPGRSDAPNESFAPPEGRLPDASKDQSHV